MNKSYIAGFFDGEGSAMALTVKRNISGRVMFRIRPVLKIAQGRKEILEQIRETLGYGTVVLASHNCYALQINSNRDIIDFADTIGEHLIIKKLQVSLLKKLAQYQDNNFSNCPYTREAMEYMLDLRDNVFKANTWTRSRIMQKYSKDRVLNEHEFVNIKDWKEKREKHRSVAFAKKGLNL
jgi:hypothetical protein